MSTKNLRLLVVLLIEGCSACQNFKDKYEGTLRELIINEGDVSISRIPYIRDSVSGKEVVVPFEEGGTDYVHPHLQSYVMGYPTFILVDEDEWRNPSSELHPYVFNRVVKNGRYTFGSLQYTPMNIVKWTKEVVKDQREEIEVHETQGLVKDQIAFCKRNARFCATIVD